MDGTGRPPDVWQRGMSSCMGVIKGVGGAGQQQLSRGPTTAADSPVVAPSGRACSHLKLIFPDDPGLPLAQA